MTNVIIRLLPDGSGRVRIHFFVHNPKGPARTPGSTIMTALGPVTLGGVSGFIACQPHLADVTPRMENGASYPTKHSDDPRAVTCPECQAAQAYKNVMRMLEGLVQQTSAPTV